jgi:hypothetical protein
MFPPAPRVADPRHPFAESLAFQRQEQGRRVLMLMHENVTDCATWRALTDLEKRVHIARALRVPEKSGLDYGLYVSRIDEYCAANAPEGSVEMASGALFGRPQASGPVVLPGGNRPAFPLGPSGGVVLPGGDRPAFPLGPSGGVVLPGGDRPAFPLGPSGAVNPGTAAAEAEGRARGGRTLLLIGMDCLTWSRMPHDNKIEAIRRGLRTPPVTRLDFDRAIHEMDSYCVSMGFRAPVAPTGYIPLDHKNPARAGGSAIAGLFGKNAGVARLKDYTSASGQLAATGHSLAAEGRALDAQMRDALSRNDYATYERLWGQASRMVQAARQQNMDAFVRPGLGLAHPENVRASGQLHLAPMSITGGLDVASWNSLTDVEKLTYVLNHAQTKELLEETRSIGLEQGYRGITEAVNAAEAAMGLDKVASSGSAAGWERQAREIVHASGQTAITETVPPGTPVTATPVATPATTPTVAAKMTVNPWVVAGLGVLVVGGVVLYRKSSEKKDESRADSRAPHDNPGGYSPYYPVAR